MFSSVEDLTKHISAAHMGGGSAGKRKRNFVDESAGVTPIIEAMPAEVAKKHRAVYDGPSRTLSIGQTSKRRK